MSYNKYERRKRIRPLQVMGGTAVVIIVLILGYYTYSAQMPENRILGLWYYLQQNNHVDYTENLAFFPDGKYILYWEKPTRRPQVGISCKEEGAYHISGSKIIMVNNRGEKKEACFYQGNTIKVEKKGKKKIFTKRK